MDDLKEAIKRNVGDALLASSVIAYLTPVSATGRQDALMNWEELLAVAEPAVPHSETLAMAGVALGVRRSSQYTYTPVIHLHCRTYTVHTTYIHLCTPIIHVYIPYEYI